VDFGLVTFATPKATLRILEFVGYQLPVPPPFAASQTPQ